MFKIEREEDQPNYNYKITTAIDPKVTLNPDTYCPQKSMQIRIAVSYEAQHDGHGWSDEDIRRYHEDLTNEIYVELYDKIKSFVDFVNPGSAHQFGGAMYNSNDDIMATPEPVDQLEYNKQVLCKLVGWYRENRPAAGCDHIYMWEAINHATSLDEITEIRKIIDGWKN